MPVGDEFKGRAREKEYAPVDPSRHAHGQVMTGVKAELKPFCPKSIYISVTRAENQSACPLAKPKSTYVPIRGEHLPMDGQNRRAHARRRRIQGEHARGQIEG